MTAEMFKKLTKILKKRRYLHRTPAGRLALALKTNRIDCVVDVGANEGQTGNELIGSGFKGRIISFEPVSEAYNGLVKAAARWPDWIVAPRMALGEHDGEIEINVSVTHNWSSIKPVHEQTVEIKPKSKIVSRETTPIQRLDQVLPRFVSTTDRLFVKIDTQGYEAEVLRGCESLMDGIYGFQLELSLVALYEGEQLYPYYFDWMRGRGYELWMVEDIAFSPELGRQLQFDAVFIRP